MHTRSPSFARRRFLWIAGAALAVFAATTSTALAGEEAHGKEKWVAS